ncbi:hypothetical protein HZU83_19930, partial [Sphaerotilus montanus]|nr:hypothetical protein [Sphaerotilus montanus]
IWGRTSVPFTPPTQLQGSAFTLVQSSVEGMRLVWGQAPPETPCREAALEALRQQVPAARALPLLEALARGVAATVVIAATLPLVLVIEVVPA